MTVSANRSEECSLYESMIDEALMTDSSVERHVRD
jgi:hypothetical protein